MRKLVELSKKYEIPEKLSIVNHLGKILVIAIDIARWIVLENNRQLEIFESLREHCVSEVLDLYPLEVDNLTKVLTQLEAKHFDDTNVKSCIQDDSKLLHLYLTNGCNLRCPHCYMYSGASEENELSFEEIVSLLNEYSSFGGEKLTLSGGEVSLRKDIVAIIRYANKVGLKTRILTNGVLWTDETIKETSKYIDSIQISIDGYSEDTNSRIRGAGNFEKALKTLDKFVSYGTKVELAITPFLDYNNGDDIDKYVNFLKRLSKKYKNENFSINLAQEVISGRDVNFSSEVQEKYLNFTNKIFSSFYNDNNVGVYSFVRVFSQDIIMDNCMYGIFSISAKGDVFYCPRIPSLSPIGNIRTMPFAEIIRLSKIAQELSNINNFSPCKNCDLKYICGGGCRIDNFPNFVNAKDIEKIDMDSIPQRECDQTEKEKFYSLMISNNEKLFR